MKLKIQIKSWLSGEVLFEYESENNSIRKTLEVAVIREADLQGANLRGANLRGANLRGADLWGANLRGTDLWGANLRGADLQGANLRGANLRGADLQGANLRGANLRGAEGLKLYWHIHHETLMENLTEPLKNRIAYIKKEKPKKEQKLRLKLMKKVKEKNLPKNEKEWDELHKKECPKCPWDGNTIFPSPPLP